MEKEKEINQELRNKIIQLIHQELNSINRITLFYDLYIEMVAWEPLKVPMRTKTVRIKENVDTIEFENFDILRYTLKFADGDPDITISTYLQETEKYEYYKSERKWYTLWLYNKKLMTTYRDIQSITTVKCGMIKFELTSEENKFLCERTKFAYEKQKSLIKDFEEKNVVDKINMRLK